MKSLILSLLFFTTLTSSAQLGVQISQLPTHTGSPLGGYLPIVIGGQTKKIAASSLVGGGGVSAEVDPYFVASPASGISGINITNWNAAFGWGNHAGLYPLLVGSYANPSWITSLPWSKITGAPSFLTGNQSILWTAGGDISGNASGATSINPSLTVTALRGSTLPSLSTGNLRYNGSAFVFDNTTYSTFSPTISGPATGHVIRYNGTSWVNSAIQAADLPDLSGSYLPLNGGTLTGTAGSGYIGLPAQSTNPSAASGVTKLFADNSGRLSWITPLGFRRTFTSPTLTADRLYTFPDRNISVAGLDDITFSATITSPATGQYPRYNGSAWVNSAIQASDLPTSNTISSFSATMPGVIFNSPVTGVNTGGAWTIAPTLKTQAQKTFLRGPVSGADATPTFGTIQATDIPDLSAYYQTVDDVSSSYYFYTDFNTNAGGSDYIVTSAGTGSGAASVSGGGGANRPNTIRLTTGTTATGRAYAASGPTSNPSGYVLGGGTWKFKTAVNVVQASTSTDRFQVMAGFLNNTSTAAQTNGAFFLYDEGGVTNGSTASGNWQCVTVTNISGSTVRTVTTLSASGTNTVQIGTWTPLEIRVNATGSSVDFYINGTLVATHPTNIPTTIASPVGWGTYVQKSVGTTTVNLDVDYAMVKSIFTTAR